MRLLVAAFAAVLACASPALAACDPPENTLAAATDRFPASGGYEFIKSDDPGIVAVVVADANKRGAQVEDGVVKTVAFAKGGAIMPGIAIVGLFSEDGCGVAAGLLPIHLLATILNGV